MNYALAYTLGARRRRGGISLPADFWSTATGGFQLETRRLDTLFQTGDTSTPVTTSGQSVGRFNDLSPFASNFEQLTSGARPIYEVVDGFPLLTFDGTDDFLRSIANVDPGTTDKLEIFIGVRKQRDSSIGMLVELSTAITNAGSFNVSAPQSAGAASYGFAVNGSQNAGRTATGFAAPNTAILSCTYDIAQATRETEILPLVNNATPTLTAGGNTNAGTGNFAAAQTFIGRRAGSTSPAQMQLYCIIARFGPLLSSADRLQAIRYTAAQVPGNLVP